MLFDVGPRLDRLSWPGKLTDVAALSGTYPDATFEPAPAVPLVMPALQDEMVAGPNCVAAVLYGGVLSGHHHEREAQGLEIELRRPDGRAIDLIRITGLSEEVATHLFREVIEIVHPHRSKNEEAAAAAASGGGGEGCPILPEHVALLLEEARRHGGIIEANFGGAAPADIDAIVQHFRRNSDPNLAASQASVLFSGDKGVFVVTQAEVEKVQLNGSDIWLDWQVPKHLDHSALPSAIIRKLQQMLPPECQLTKRLSEGDRAWGDFEIRYLTPEKEGRRYLTRSRKVMALVSPGMILTLHTEPIPELTSLMVEVRGELPKAQAGKSIVPDLVAKLVGLAHDMAAVELTRLEGRGEQLDAEREALPVVKQDALRNPLRKLKKAAGYIWRSFADSVDEIAAQCERFHDLGTVGKELCIGLREAQGSSNRVKNLAEALKSYLGDIHEAMREDKEQVTTKNSIRLAALAAAIGPPSIAAGLAALHPIINEPFVFGCLAAGAVTSLVLWGVAKWWEYR